MIIRKKFVLLGLLIVVVISFVSFGVIKHMESVNSSSAEKGHKIKFSPRSVPAGTDSKYDMVLTMNEGGTFNLESTVTIKNISKDSWRTIVFYFIPNMFTKSISSRLDQPAAIHFNKVTVNGESSSFELEKDTLNVPLKEKLEKGKEIKVTFNYDFTLPEDGLRFTKSHENYYLAQFYPMVATYRNHKWNKEEYRFKGETYHTAFSDFKVTYNIPDNYTMVSTSEYDEFPSKKNGVFEVKNTKEIFVALLKKPLIFERNKDKVNIRVIGLSHDDALYEEISEEASDALHYFQEKIGPYPFKQLDIIVDQLGMEYPGVVTAHSVYNASVSDESLKRIVVHEIAHQWFYGVISNDPYHNAWLDEGFADFATTLYLFSKSNQDIPYKLMYSQIENLKPLPVNLPLDQYGSNSSSYIYGKSNTMLWTLFEKRGGKKEAEKFLKSYYKEYKYKEVDTKEFIRFTTNYFNFKDDKFFKEWLIH
ncbi:M1 family metallopeptidase [Priestia aryabhattai]